MHTNKLNTAVKQTTQRLPCTLTVCSVTGLTAMQAHTHDCKDHRQGHSRAQVRVFYNLGLVYRNLTVAMYQYVPLPFEHNGCRLWLVMLRRTYFSPLCVPAPPPS